MILGAVVLMKVAAVPMRMPAIYWVRKEPMGTRITRPRVVSTTEAVTTLMPKRSMSTPERKPKMMPASRGAVAMVLYWLWLRSMAARSLSARELTWNWPKSGRAMPRKSIARITTPYWGLDFSFLNMSYRSIPNYSICMHTRQASFVASPITPTLWASPIT